MPKPASLHTHRWGWTGLARKPEASTPPPLCEGLARKPEASTPPPLCEA